MPEIDNRVSFGNLLTIASFAVLVALAWGSLRSESAASQRQVEDHEGRLRTLEQLMVGNLASINERLTAIEEKLAK